MLLTAPVRPSDFINGQRALLEWVEELAALGRLTPSDIDPYPEGCIIRVQPSERINKWLEDHGPFTPRFLIEDAILDRFGSTASLGREARTAQLNIGLSSWRDQPQLVRRLRSQYLGTSFGEDSVTATEHFILAITEALQLPERPSNSRQLPNWCSLKWGALIRLNPSTVERALDYLLLEPPAQGEISSPVPLGAGVMSRIAHSPSPDEPMQIGLASRWNEDLMAKTLSRWLRSFQVTKINNEVSTL